MTELVESIFTIVIGFGLLVMTAKGIARFYEDNKFLGNRFWGGLIATIAVILYTLRWAKQAPPGDFAGSSLGAGIHYLIFGLGCAFILLVITILYGLYRHTNRVRLICDKEEESEQ